MEKAQSLAQAAITAARTAGADAADALYYASASLSVSHRLGKQEGLERSESAGIGLRVFIGEQIASVSSTDTSADALREMAQRAVAMARLSPADSLTRLAPEALLAKTIPDLQLYDPAEPDVRVLQVACAEAEAAALAVAGITNSEGADAGFSQTTMALATSNGFAEAYRTSSHSLSVSVLAGSGTAMERDYDYSQTRFAADLRAPAAIGSEAARRALARVDARKVSTQRVPVIFDPRVARRLLGSFLGAINGSSIARGTSFLKDSLGKQVFASGVSIVDDPHRLRGLSSRPFDGEGLATSPMEWVSGGTLNSWILDLRSAAKLGMQPTGHASRGMSGSPSPSSSNSYIAAGKCTPNELMSDIKSGFYVTELIGSGVNLVTGDFSQGASGLWIDNGQIAYAVSEVTIAGRLQDMFTALTPANDLVFEFGSNSPTLRIEGMTIAGR